MTPTCHSSFSRGLTWLLVAAFLLASLPAPAFAQQVESASPAEAARARIAQLRAARAGIAPLDSGGGDGGGESAIIAEPSGAGDGELVYQLNLKDSPLDILLDKYAELTGRTMIKAPGVNATFTFKAHGKLTRAELIQAMDSLLTMNNITLVPLGTRFYRVVQTDKAPAEGMAIQRGIPETGLPESDALVSQMVGLKYLEMEDALTIVQAMLHGFGKVQRFDRINSLLVTETSSNLKRIYEILEMVDQPTETRIETRVYEIKHAKASDIASRLNELVSDGEKKEEVAQVAQPPAGVVRRPASMIRARQPAAAPEAPAAPDSAALEAAMAERGIVQGKVKVLTDERTNIIIVISRPSNFVFFDKIVAVLDRPVDPEVIVQVLALEYADAEAISGLLNDFIGAAKSESATTPRTGDDAGAPATDSRARALEDFVRARAAAADRVRQAAGEGAVSRIGQLSPNTKILADKRTNTLLLMGTKSDIAALEDVVKKVDIMLAQVLIEAVILEVNLNNNTAYGVNWLQKSMTAYTQRLAGPGGGVSIREPIASWGGNFGANNFATTAGDTVTRAFGGGSGLNYFFTFADLNIDMVLSMVASSGEGRVLATPVILTTDNTEASIMSGQQIPIRTGDVDSGGTTRSNYEYKNVGIQLKVKPRINPSRYVTLEITQSADTLGEPVDVGTAGKMTSINKREMNASISVPSRSTIVLGGLVQTDYQALNTRLPILGSIPLIGGLFRSEDKTRKRTELLVLITPYVLMSTEEARAETTRLHGASNVAAEDWYRGWSDSSLAPFSPAQLREIQKEEKTAHRRAQVKVPAEAGPAAAPPVAVIEPAAAMPRPTPDAQDAETFGREVERIMQGQAEAAGPEAPAGAAPEFAPAGALPAPTEPTATAPFAFEPAAAPAPEAVPEPAPAPKPERKPRRALLGTKVKSEPKPSMFPAPPPEPEALTGESP
jgi:general secretion pathway protein D